METTTDSTLMQAVRRGDAAALGELFHRHQAAVHALCHRLTLSADAADDLVQETFLRVVRGRDGYRGDASFRTWLYRIARNVCLDHLAAARRERRLRERWAVEVGEGRRDAEPERAGLLEAALGRLPVEAREVIVLARYLELSSGEMAGVLECTPGAARVRLHRAMTELREICRALESEDHDVQRSRGEDR